MVFDHILHGQILDCNHLVFTNQSSCQLIKDLVIREKLRALALRGKRSLVSTAC
jgi:hypothetical protein